jgi:hypothetical protein
MEEQCVMNSVTAEGGRIVISKVITILTDNVPADVRRYLYASLPTSGHGWSRWSMCRITIRGYRRFSNSMKFCSA